MNEKIEAARERVAREARCWTHGGPSQLREAVMDLEIAEKEAALRYHYDATSHGTGFMEGERCLLAGDVLALLNAERTPPRANWEADGTLVNKDGGTKLSVLYWDADAAAGEKLARKAARLLAAALNKERTP